MKRLKFVYVGAIICLGAATMIPTMAFAAGADAAWGSSRTGYSSPYENADGSYPSYGDFSRSFNGVPCGIACKQRAERRQTVPRRQRYYGLYTR
ncbi:hypothetical protein MHY1_00568 [Methylovirgula sp. HY1]|nr:hypothetical protein MHY1_00568 [Methylovirgula sp. HY1]